MNVAVGAGWRGASGAQDLCRWGRPLPQPLSVSPLPPRSSSCLGHPQGFCSRRLQPSGPGCPAPGAGCSPATGHGVGQGLALPSGLGLPTQTKNLTAEGLEKGPSRAPAGGRSVPACWRLILVVVAAKMSGSTVGHGSPARCSHCRLRARAGDAGRESWALGAWPGASARFPKRAQAQGARGKGQAAGRAARQQHCPGGSAGGRGSAALQHRQPQPLAGAAGWRGPGQLSQHGKTLASL